MQPCEGVPGQIRLPVKTSRHEPRHRDWKVCTSGIDLEGVMEASLHPNQGHSPECRTLSGQWIPDSLNQFHKSPKSRISVAQQ